MLPDLPDVTGFEPALAVGVEEVLSCLFRHVVVALGDVEAADHDLTAGSDRVGDPVATLLPVDQLDFYAVQRRANTTYKIR
jgi:hypothetical protein